MYKIMVYNTPKAFDILSHDILIEKLMKHGLGEQVAEWIENWLNGWVQRVVGHTCSWQPVTSYMCRQ